MAKKNEAPKKQTRKKNVKPVNGKPFMAFQSPPRPSNETKDGKKKPWSPDQLME